MNLRLFGLFSTLCKARTAGEPGRRILTTTPDTQRPIHANGPREWLDEAPEHRSIHSEKTADNAV